MYKLNTSEALRFGWETFKKRPALLIGGFFIAMLLSSIVSGIADPGEGSAFAPQNVLLGVVSFLIGVFLELAMISFAIRAHDDVQSVRLHDLWNPSPFLRYLIGQILTGIIVIVGLLLLIVPGVIAALALFPASYLIVDRGVQPIEAIKQSYAMTKGHWLEIFIFILALIGINILGLLALVVGLLVSVPVSMLASVHIYRQISRHAHVENQHSHAPVV